MKNTATQTLLVMGARRTYGDVYSQSPTRLVALDPVTKEPVVALWIYEGETTSAEGTSFIDAHSMKKLTVSATGYLSVTLNVANALGSDLMLSLLKDDGSIALIDEGGLLPPQTADNHSFIGIFAGTEGFYAGTAEISVTSIST